MLYDFFSLTFLRAMNYGTFDEFAKIVDGKWA